MSRKLLIPLLAVSILWELVIMLFGGFIYESVSFSDSQMEVLQALDYIARGTIIFTAIYILKKLTANPDDSINYSDRPILPARILAIIVLLSILIYPAFFIDKGYFSNNLISSMDLLAMDLVNINSDIIENEEAITTLTKRMEKINDSLSVQGNAFNTTQQELKNAKQNLKINYKRKDLNQQRYANFKNRLLVLQETKHFENLYYVMRALCLGALGAILTLLATSSIKSKKIPTYKSLFNEANYWQSLITNCLAGSIVSVVAFALFYTKQISIFDSSLAESTHAPDFWRSTLLCLIAGAFAEKIYEAVSTKVNDYVDTSGNGSNNAIQPTPKNGAPDGGR